MNTNLPLVSIVAVCYNHEKYLLETLNSIINQSYKNIQLIIIDDCSTDNSVVKIKEWIELNNVDCIFVEQKKNKGLCKNLNQGISLSKGTFYQSIACDDILQLDKIEKQVIFLSNEPSDVMMVCSNFQTIDSNGLIILEAYFKKQFEFPRDVFSAILTNDLGYAILVHSPTVLLRKSVFENVGMYDEDFKQDDFYMWLNISNKFSIAYINEVLASYRILETSLSKKFKFDGDYYFERLEVSSKFLTVDTSKRKAVGAFQLKQIKKILGEGIIRNDEKLVNRGLHYFHKLSIGLTKVKLGIDKNLFHVFVTFPSLFKEWSKSNNFSFEKMKYNIVFSLLKAPFFLRVFKHFNKNDE